MIMQLHCASTFLDSSHHNNERELVKICCDYIETMNVTELYRDFYEYFTEANNDTNDIFIKETFEEKRSSRIKECEMLNVDETTDMIINVSLPLVGSLILIFNVIQMWAIINKSCEKNKLAKSMIYILNLSLSDACLGLGALIYGILNQTMDLPTSANFFRINICGTVSIVSVLTLIAITFERLHAVKRPIRYRQNPSKVLHIIFCISFWIAAIILVVPYYYKLHPKDTKLDLVLVLVPVLTFPAVAIFIGTYPYILYTLHQQKLSLEKNVVGKSKTQKKIFMLSVVIVSVFSASWLPVSIFGLYKKIAQPTDAKMIVIQLTLFSVVLLNSLINPFIYFTFMRESIKKGIRKFILRHSGRSSFQRESRRKLIEHRQGDPAMTAITKM